MSLTGSEQTFLSHLVEIAKSGHMLWPYERDALIDSPSERNGLIVSGWPCEDARAIVKLLLERAGFTGEATVVAPTNTPDGRGVLIAGYFQDAANDPRDRGWTHLTLTSTAEGFRLGGVDLAQGENGFEVATPTEVSK